MEHVVKGRAFFEKESIFEMAITNSEDPDFETIPKDTDQDSRDDQDSSNYIPMPEPQTLKFVKIRLLPMVIIMEIFQTLMTTGMVSLVIITLRLMAAGGGAIEVAVRSLCFILMLLTFTLFAHKWKKLVPFIASICYCSVVFHMFFLMYKFLDACFLQK